MDSFHRSADRCQLSSAGASQSNGAGLNLGRSQYFKAQLFPTGALHVTTHQTNKETQKLSVPLLLVIYRSVPMFPDVIKGVHRCPYHHFKKSVIL